MTSPLSPDKLLQDSPELFSGPSTPSFPPSRGLSRLRACSETRREAKDQENREEYRRQEQQSNRAVRRHDAIGATSIRMDIVGPI